LERWPDVVTRLLDAAPNGANPLKIGVAIKISLLSSYACGEVLSQFFLHSFAAIQIRFSFAKPMPRSGCDAPPFLHLSPITNRSLEDLPHHLFALFPECCGIGEIEGIAAHAFAAGA
jgi:hypothetical protein